MGALFVLGEAERGKEGQGGFKGRRREWGGVGGILGGGVGV